ncbi:hypothetical protein ALC62_12922 [Cyphomyrmex costatus]|uniref:CARD domain-containing protein n=1 Tax=Cyphomyrmex costatus TaxID=456900 RepID=A0A195C8C0_9HYME|nr:hypothetical protein ALC62_12922 [Cyphomyrmex costatus]
MEKLHKDILSRLRKKIIDDLDVDNDIIQPLRNEYILTEDHIRKIYIGVSKEERAGKLLDILPLKCLFDAIVSDDEKDIIVKENYSEKNITVLYGEDVITETGVIKGIISNLQLSPDANTAMYVLDNKIIELISLKNGVIFKIFEEDKPIQFAKIIHRFNYNTILCKEENDDLKVCILNSKKIIHNTYVIDDEYIMIVMQNGIIALLCIRMNWRLISQIDLSNLFSSITFSCLSCNQKYLAILNELHHLILLYINYGNFYGSTTETEQFYHTYSFPQKAICCDISKNERYIAVGFESGQISIIDIQKWMEINRLFFHASPIIQLYWAPVTINVPILLSLTNDELIWWNVALTKTTKKNTRSRMGRSTSVPSFSSNSFWDLQVPNSRSIDAGVSEIQDEMISSTSNSNYTVNSVNRYWENKKGKNPERPELLTVVALPSSRDPKVCISPDFTKFVMVDMYGSVNTFKLIDESIN